jgi:hypothetical protein
MIPFTTETLSHRVFPLISLWIVSYAFPNTIANNAILTYKPYSI